MHNKLVELIKEPIDDDAHSCGREEAIVTELDNRSLGKLIVFSFLELK